MGLELDVLVHNEFLVVLEFLLDDSNGELGLADTLLELFAGFLGRHEVLGNLVVGFCYVATYLRYHLLQVESDLLDVVILQLYLLIDSVLKVRKTHHYLMRLFHPQIQQFELLLYEFVWLVY